MTRDESLLHGYVRGIIMPRMLERGYRNPSEQLLKKIEQAYILRMSPKEISSIIKEKADRYINKPDLSISSPTILDVAAKKLINPNNKLVILVRKMSIGDLMGLDPDEIDYSSYYHGLFPQNAVWDYFAYELYEQSSLWRQKGKEVIALRGNKCQMCRIEFIENIHHWTYENFCYETPEDLWGVCRGWHTVVHERRPTRSKIPIIEVKK